ncbi:hypothetical protein ACIOWM_07005 [Streptomyces anulatus]
MAELQGLARVRAELDEIERENTEREAAHNPDCECLHGKATQEVVDRVRRVLTDLDG